MKTIILGAGVTGLAAGYKTGYSIFESSGNHGGICRSYRIKGYEFAQGGGHWLFENDNTQEAMAFVRSLVDLKSYDRRAGIYYNKIFPYPIQTYSQKKNTFSEGYFKEWLMTRFGNEMCNMFFYPFNEKYTAGLMDEIIQFDSYKTPPAGSVGFVSRFHDPVGGLSLLMDKMAAKCHVNYSKAAIHVNYKDKVVIFHDGDHVKYDRLVSTIPLDQMLTLCQKTDYELPYSSVFVLNIGAEPGINLPLEHWLYVPYCESGFYRIGFYTNVDQDKAPNGNVSLSVEMAVKAGEAIDVDQKTLEIVAELQSWGFIGDVHVTDPTFVKHAYTWNKYLDEREFWMQWLEEWDIVCLGRYATWKFQGMLESIQQGLSIK